MHLVGGADGESLPSGYRDAVAGSSTPLDIQVTDGTIDQC